MLLAFWFNNYLHSSGCSHQYKCGHIHNNYYMLPIKSHPIYWQTNRAGFQFVYYMLKKIIVKCKNVELPQHLVQPQSRSLTGNITDAQKFHNFSFWRRKKRHFPQTRFHARMVTKIISYSNLINEQKPFLYSTAVSVLVWISVFFFERRVSSTIMPIRLFLQEEVLCFFYVTSEVKEDIFLII